MLRDLTEASSRPPPWFRHPTVLSSPDAVKPSQTVAQRSAMPRLTAEWTGDFDEVRRIASESAGAFDAPFARRFAAHFPTLHPLFVELYGERDDGSSSSRRSSPRRRHRGAARPARAEGARRAARAATRTGTSRTRCSAGSATSTATRAASHGVRDSIPVLRRARPDLPAPDAAVREPGGQLRRRLRGVELPAGRTRALGTMDELADARGRAAARRHLARRGLHLQPHQQRARVGAQGRRGRPELRGLLPDLPRSRRCPTRTSRPCARSSPTTTRARSCSCRTAAGSGRRSTTSSGT